MSRFNVRMLRAQQVTYNYPHVHADLGREWLRGGNFSRRTMRSISDGTLNLAKPRGSGAWQDTHLAVLA